MFADRTTAGEVLARSLERWLAHPDTLVLGIPRGGVIVAGAVARHLALPLDVAIAAKVGAPDNPEFAIGALSADGRVIPNPVTGFSVDEVEMYAQPAREKVRRQMALLRAGRPDLSLAGKTVLLVDDGLATGLTAIAAVEWLRREGATRIVVGVPVASVSAKASLLEHADEVVAVETPAWFSAVGQFYRDFGQTSDDEVLEVLHSVRADDSR